MGGGGGGTDGGGGGGGGYDGGGGDDDDHPPVIDSLTYEEGNDLGLIINIEITGIASDEDSDLKGYVFEFGDGESGSTVNPTHIYTSAGEYTTTLIVKDEKGAVSSTVQTKVTIEDPISEEVQDEEHPLEDTSDEGESSILGRSHVII